MLSRSLWRARGFHSSVQVAAKLGSSRFRKTEPAVPAPVKEAPSVDQAKALSRNQPRSQGQNQGQNSNQNQPRGQNQRGGQNRNNNNGNKNNQGTNQGQNQGQNQNRNQNRNNNNNNNNNNRQQRSQKPTINLAQAETPSLMKIMRKQEEARAKKSFNTPNMSGPGEKKGGEGGKKSHEAGKKGEEKPKNVFLRHEDFVVATPKTVPPPPVKEKKVKEIEIVRPRLAIPSFVSISNLATILQVSLETLSSTMVELGFDQETTDHNHVLDGETAQLIADDLGFDVYTNETQGVDLFLAPKPSADEKSKLPLRPPIVTIMGHVDHGKTTLLDYIRKSSVAEKEHGGITQHIGAFSVKAPKSGKQITFLDTPGHAAFLKMRERGATVTDIVILVVAGDDSVMPQTKEAIKHVHAAGVELVVAINKCDKESVTEETIQKVYSDLGANEVYVEDYGGDIACVQVSGKSGLGVDTLEETLVAISEVLDLRSSPTAKVEGIVLESQVKKGVGATATVLVHNGTLKPGQVICAGTVFCKVKAMKDSSNKVIKEAGPGTPVEVTGWKELPASGDQVLQAESEQQAKQVAENRQKRAQLMQQMDDIKIINEKRKQQKIDQEAEEKRLERAKLGLPPIEEDEPEAKCQLAHFIVRGDVHGSVEAVSESIADIGNDEVHVNILSRSVGPPTANDVEIARTANASLLLFNVKPTRDVILKARQAGVPIIEQTIIYRVIEHVTEHVTSLLPKIIRDKEIASAQVKDIFEISIAKKKVKIAGCRVTMGPLRRSHTVKVMRDGEEVFRGTVSSLKHNKDDVTEMAKGQECGIALEKWDELESGDIIIAVEDEEVPRYL
ncbi:hypothetical protein B0I72DRAFT_135640 [Yarrowia lipolytica]|uniref:Translation initiation factor IF-2, mitochondrial n=2 Tax=Yarrowia lipolytica TaxID=4952 RepID=Q6CDQ9_YARLI|nr:YALI0B21978p [Yarrowia lipolytica CLIB122]AOW02050.1 hypothetical protein YALI1_B28572g [Yarrowia lipolytica]KAB8283441.1 hypothetical protein BKA91DRAFT_136728 [Yarrowia lipolytica]KAE8173326.1 hypothetical protein BKA90DRAFT_135905 [Yarrowia lipolytica]KAJ8052818.1 hypothetical protein LXG23DRAFT_50766 [Yarrowia lipolytica]RDW28945.1 hypothetical protein B0I71DRAFT_126595 [Yarrowia lipolytica]|eukprot:XP_501203.1 YALI0B21978p [Yarrowia lipolytica CLIB122]